MAEAISLYFQNRVRICGELLQGHVQLNVPLALEDGIQAVRVKLRGSIYVEITESTTHTANGSTHSSSDTQRRRIEVLRADASLWTRDGPQMGALNLPFQFLLPLNLPPSFHCSVVDRKGVVSYAIEVVADRPGIFKRNRRIASIFSLVPAATPQDLAFQHSLLQGWSGDWKAVVYEDRIRRGIWGDYSVVKTKLVMPALAAFPMSTPFPFRIHITTETKPMKHSDGPEDKGKALFPAPPLNFSQLKLTLIRNVHFRTFNRNAHAMETVLLLGGTGDSPQSATHLTEADPPEWIPSNSDKSKGIWRRTVHMQSTMCLSIPPAFNTEILSWDYALRFRVPFPGIGNDVESTSAIWIVPGFACPQMQPFSRGSDSALTYADIPPPGPAPNLDLPPAYWAGEHHDWDDKKS
ncbi:Arrestin-N domain-containing protein [Mycena venus]|uniref:Arrestin-N domain-containing protein n=1 Tax=Mycena venus TaxID=2733690 RepID=A0A8H7CKE5_9AGAR|nr:Arrestin-N domain-containing protein [Mycena venus]